MRKFTLVTSLILLLFFSCKKDEANVERNAVTKAGLEDDRANKVEFSQTLARALQNQEVRTILKQEALKKIDNDYDVLYGLSKNSTSSSGKTLHELISAYAEDKERFDEIVQSLPLLTIYVPQLDEFDAEKWDAKNQIPIVAIRDVNDRKSNKPLLAYDASGNLKELSYKEKPKHPVVVVKDNERVELKRNSHQEKELGKQSEGNDIYTAITKAFVNPNSTIKLWSAEGIRDSRPRRVTDTTTREPIIDNSHQISAKATRYAYEKKLESQRDYVYYGIDPSNGIDSGKLTHRYAEHIVSIEMETEAALQKITDDWTDGNLEIIINVTMLNRSGSPESIRKGINCTVDDLKYNTERAKREGRDYPRPLKLRSDYIMEYFLPNPLEIETWDAYKYGDRWKFTVSEFDPGRETTTVTTVSSEFSGNFNGNVGIDVLGIFKFGIGGGGSSKETKSTQVTVKTTDTSDDLYEGILNFYTPIYSREESRGGREGKALVPKVYTVNTGLIRLRVEPLERS